MIDFNRARLAEKLGITTLSNNLLVAADANQQRAARAILDFNPVSGSGEDQFDNVLYWIKEAHNAGVKEGVRQEREAWEMRIKSIFNIRD